MAKILTKFIPLSVRKDIAVLLLVLVLLLITPINTDITLPHIFYMSLTLGLSILIPYLAFRRNEKNAIHFQFNPGLLKSKNKIAWIIFAGFIGYLIFPFYFATTSAYLNWPDARTAEEVILLFLGTNALAIWDELFFVNTILPIFNRHLSFTKANLLQAIFWTIFLYELGFIGWFVVMVFIFALIQGITFRLYKSLAFLIATHLSIDLMLFLAILHAHGNLPFPFFITG